MCDSINTMDTWGHRERYNWGQRDRLWRPDCADATQMSTSASISNLAKITSSNICWSCGFSSVCQFLTQSLLVSVRLNKAGKLRRASGLSGAAYRHLMGQKSQSVLTNAHHCTASLVVPQASEMGGRVNYPSAEGKLEQTVRPTLTHSLSRDMRRWPLGVQCRHFVFTPALFFSFLFVSDHRPRSSPPKQACLSAAWCHSESRMWRWRHNTRGSASSALYKGVTAETSVCGLPPIP